MVANPVRGLLDRKRSEEHLLPSSNESKEKHKHTNEKEIGTGIITKYTGQRKINERHSIERVWHSAGREPSLIIHRKPVCFLCFMPNLFKALLFIQECFKKNLNAPRPSEHPPVELFLTFSALVANPKKTTLDGAQSRSWYAEQGKKEKEEQGKKEKDKIPVAPVFHSSSDNLVTF